MNINLLWLFIILGIMIFVNSRESFRIHPHSRSHRPHRHIYPSSLPYLYPYPYSYPYIYSSPEPEIDYVRPLQNTWIEEIKLPNFDLKNGVAIPIDNARYITSVNGPSGFKFLLLDEAGYLVKEGYFPLTFNYNITGSNTLYISVDEPDNISPSSVSIGVIR